LIRAFQVASSWKYFSKSRSSGSSLYYQRDDEGLPREWIARMKDAIATLTWKFSAARMICDYTREAYIPAGRKD
jgi:glucan phosphorylase